MLLPAVRARRDPRTGRMRPRIWSDRPGCQGRETRTDLARPARHSHGPLARRFVYRILVASVGQWDADEPDVMASRLTPRRGVRPRRGRISKHRLTKANPQPP